MIESASKRCSKCGGIKPLGEFTKDRSKRYGRASRCRDCTREFDRRRYQANRIAKLQYQHRYYQANAEERRGYGRQYRDANLQKVTGRDRRWRDSLREAVFGHYGRWCACCGATHDLTIDHVNGDGAQHRQELFGNRQRGSLGFYIWLIRHGFPDEPALQTLCGSCNKSKSTGEHCRLDHDLEYDVENDAW